MHLRIQVDIHSLQGTVCAWVPPPPNDRLWFGFITAPELKAEVTPIVANDVSLLTVLPCCTGKSAYSQACGKHLTCPFAVFGIGAVTLHEIRLASTSAACQNHLTPQLVRCMREG